jgi:hypothetical protein
MEEYKASANPWIRYKSSVNKVQAEFHLPPGGNREPAI